MDCPVSNSRRILVVEDEYFIAEDLVQVLRNEGMIIAGPVASVDAASVELGKDRVDCAILDINLDGSITFEVAALLRDHDIPFLFLTGYDASVVPDRFGDAVFLRKPHEARLVIDAIRGLIRPPVDPVEG